MIQVMGTKPKHFHFPLFLNPQASLVWIMAVGRVARVGLEHCQRDADGGGGKSGLGNGGDGHDGDIEGIGGGD